MHVSVQTLRDLIDLSLSPEQMADALTWAGLEVESMKVLEDDTIFELKVTPNRPDALSHIGIARELSALNKTRSSFLVSATKELGGSIHDVVQINLIHREACPRYACRVIEGVSVGPSPEWLDKKLRSLDLKPVNNIVDITNWVLFERGQPLHAFDLDQILKSNKNRVSIKIRLAEQGEKLVTIDHQERILNSQDLVIADEEKPIALAGIMGGHNTEVSDATHHILLESAYFEPTRIRKTAKRLGMSTDASYRFERGTDPNGVLVALDRAANLIQEIAGGKIRREALDVYPKPIQPIEIYLRPQRLALISGLQEIDIADLRARFLALGIETVGRAHQDALHFRIPTFRPDLTQEVDLVEEAMRLIGFDQIPERLEARKDPLAMSWDNSLERFERQIRVFFSQAGFYEALNYAFGSPQLFKAFQSTDLIRLKNPLGEEYSVMRPSLIPALIQNLNYNLRQQVKKINLFEIGTVFLDLNSKGKKPSPELLNISGMNADSYAHENLRLAGLIHLGDFFTLKGILETWFKSLKLKALFVSSNIKFLHPKQSAEIQINNQIIGYLGSLHPNLKQDSWVFEINLDLLKSFCFKTSVFKPLPKFPKLQRDLAFILDEPIPAGNLISEIENFQPIQEILEDLKIFDVYQGKGLPAGKKSIAVSLSLRSSQKTLKEEEIQPLIQNLLEDLKTKLGAELRAA